VQVKTDDDELELAYYLFDDLFLQERPGRGAYLLHNEWWLPEEVPASRAEHLNPTVRGGGETYALVFDFHMDLRNYEHVDDDEYDPWAILNAVHRLDGVRLPQLARFLATSPAAEWPFELKLIRSQLFPSLRTASTTEDAFLLELRAHPQHDAPWAVFGDWFEEQGRHPVGLELLEQALRRCSRLPVVWIDQGLDSTDFGGADILTDQGIIANAAEKIRRTGNDPDKSMIRVGEHVAQFCLHTFYHHYLKADVFQHWIFFDDLWAAAHPDLAESLLRYARRWDVLSDD
jgi:uncharacterized protein (TIGR02996 family)